MQIISTNAPINNFANCRIKRRAQKLFPMFYSRFDGVRIVRAVFERRRLRRRPRALKEYKAKNRIQNGIIRLPVERLGNIVKAL